MMKKYNPIAEAIKLALHARRTGFDDRAYYTKQEAIKKAMIENEKK